MFNKITLMEARANKGFTVEKVAEILNIDLDLLEELEFDSSDIDIDLLQKLASLYDVKADDVYLGIPHQRKLSEYAYKIRQTNQLLKILEEYLEELYYANLRVKLALDEDAELEKLYELSSRVAIDNDKALAVISFVKEALESMEN